MKIYLMTTENWKDIRDGIKEAETFLKKSFDISFTVKNIDLDVTNPLYYHVGKSWSWFTLKETKSIHGSVIRSLGESYGGKDYDYYGLIVDKSKSLETSSLYGQHEGTFKTIEVYAKKTSKKYYGMSYVAYNLVHEFLHAYANFKGINDTLHQYLAQNKKSLEGHIAYLTTSQKTDVVIHNGIDAGLKGRKNKPKELIIHHTGGSDKNPLADTTHHTFNMVKKSHKGKGWLTIGYHYFIEKDGKIIQGRPDDTEGAHCVGRNMDSIGICLAGNFDTKNPTEAQLKSLKLLTDTLKKKHGITKVSPHRAYANKSCPGRNLQVEKIFI